MKYNLHQIFGDHIKENEMGRTWGMYGGEEKYIQYSDLKTRRKGGAWKTEVLVGGKYSNRGQVVGFCEHANEPFCSINVGNFVGT